MAQVVWLGRSPPIDRTRPLLRERSRPVGAGAGELRLVRSSHLPPQRPSDCFGPGAIAASAEAIIVQSLAPLGRRDCRRTKDTRGAVGARLRALMPGRLAALALELPLPPRAGLAHQLVLGPAAGIAEPARVRARGALTAINGRAEQRSDAGEAHEHADGLDAAGLLGGIEPESASGTRRPASMPG